MADRLKMTAYEADGIPFRIVYSRRKTIEIAVHPDLNVIVKAPKRLAQEEINRFVLKKSGWIKQKLDHFQYTVPRSLPRTYVNGELHLYLGREYRLDIVAGEKERVEFLPECLQIVCRGEATAERVQHLLEQWYRERAREKFVERLGCCLAAFPQLAGDSPKLAIRKMKTRWGSLSPNGTVNLNLDLIRAHPECIDYVITHELCHTQHRNHGVGFYRLLESIMPDWKRRKQELERTLA